MNQLSEKLASLTATNSHMVNHSHSLEETLASSTKQIDSLGRESYNHRQEIERLKSANGNLEQRRAELETQVYTLTANIRATDQNLQHVTETSKASETRLQSVMEQKSTAEESMSLLKSQNARLESALSNATEEINKALLNSHREMK